MAESIKF